MSKNTNTTKSITKTSNNTLDIINKIQIESQNLFVFPNDIVSMIIDKIITYFNNDLSNVKCCDICCGNYEFINKFIKLNAKGINIKYLNNNLIKYYSELFNELNTNDKNKFNSNYYISKKYSLSDTKHNHLIICNLLNVTRNNEQQIKVINNLIESLSYHKNICFCVIPEELISDCDRFNKIRKILSCCQIMEIIQCNSDIFYPKYYTNNINVTNINTDINTDIKCNKNNANNPNRYCILIFRKYNLIEYHKFNVKVINYYNDGYSVIGIGDKNKRIKIHKANIIVHNTYDFKINNWFDIVNEDVNIKLIHNEVLNSIIHYYKHKYNKALIDYMIHENLFNNQNGGRQNAKCRLKGGIIKSWKEIKLRDVLEYVNVNMFNIYYENGIYPLITNCRVDNGIIGYIDQCSYCDVSITISINNPVICYYHNYPVAIDESVRLFKIKDKLIDPHLLTVLINYELINRDYEVISIKDIMGIIIYIPVFYDF